MERLYEIKGMGDAKIIRLAAALEIARRVSSSILNAEKSKPPKSRLKEKAPRVPFGGNILSRFQFARAAPARRGCAIRTLVWYGMVEGSRRAIVG